MSIVALKKKYLESKNISHNKQFSLNSRQSLKYCTFNMGSFSQTSVKSSSYIHNRRKQWKSLMVNSLPENFNGDSSAFKHICNNWVQTTGADENYIENKALTAICDNSNNALIESNYCNISKKIGSEPSYISKKVKTLECSKIGFNRSFPYNVPASKPSFISCKDKPVGQIYNAHEYYDFNENYYARTPIVDINKIQTTQDTINTDNIVFLYSLNIIDESGSIRKDSLYSVKLKHSDGTLKDARYSDDDNSNLDTGVPVTGESDSDGYISISNFKVHKDYTYIISSKNGILSSNIEIPDSADLTLYTEDEEGFEKYLSLSFDDIETHNINNSNNDKLSLNHLTDLVARDFEATGNLNSSKEKISNLLNINKEEINKSISSSTNTLIAVNKVKNFITNITTIDDEYNTDSSPDEKEAIHNNIKSGLIKFISDNPNTEIDITDNTANGHLKQIIDNSYLSKNDGIKKNKVSLLTKLNADLITTTLDNDTIQNIENSYLHKRFKNRALVRKYRKNNGNIENVDSDNVEILNSDELKDDNIIINYVSKPATRTFQCLPDSSHNIIELNGVDRKYEFNGVSYDSYDFIGLNIGTYYFNLTNEDHEFKIETPSKNSIVLHRFINNTFGKVNERDLENTEIKGYFAISVIKPFKYITFYCINHGVMGSEKRIRFNHRCTTSLDRSQYIDSTFFDTIDIPSELVVDSASASGAGDGDAGDGDAGDGDGDAGDGDAGDGADTSSSGGTTYEYVLTSYGNSAYLFTVLAPSDHTLTVNQNPDLNININDTLVLKNNSHSSHPLIIEDSNGTKILEPVSELTFKPSDYTAGPYQYKCDIHSRMQGYINVSD